MTEQKVPTDGPLLFTLKTDSLTFKENNWNCKVTWKLLCDTGRCDVWEFTFEDLGAPVATRIVEFCGESKTIFESGKHAFFLEPNDPDESLPKSSDPKPGQAARESPPSQNATVQ